MNTVYIVIAVVLGVGILVFLSGGSSRSEHPPENATDDDVLALAKQGQKIQAIKWYRTLHGVGLKDAKEAVEGMMKERG